ncbi:vomeronasal type-2 receptor 26-like, partial [Python bivittatus]|uniref:Vomeronasal type-2 receptor 26-like n=1 Tax=Python bivittatus TaxID=176946 RepID=A0A9F5JA82_PYTBI
MELLSTWEKFIPNYKCDASNNPVAVIGGPNVNTYLPMTTILSIYKVLQLTYGSAPLQTTKIQTTFLYSMFPNWSLQYIGIIQLLLFFKWTWVGALYLDDDNGEEFAQLVLPTFLEKGICFDFIKKFPQVSFSSDIGSIVVEGFTTFAFVLESSATVVVINGEIQTMMVIRTLLYFTENEHISGMKKVWIMSAQMDITSLPFQRTWDMDFIHGALSLAVHSNEVSGFQNFLHIRKHISETEDGFIRDFWQEAFNCLLPGSLGDSPDGENCTGEEKLENLPGSVFEMSMTSHSYSIYNAVYAVAHALQAMDSSKFSRRILANVNTGKPLHQ